VNRGEAEVVVVGAGLAGLSAAWQLADEGFDVIVLEARDRVGGRTKDVALADGTVVELGGQYVGPGQSVVLELIADLGLETEPTWTGGESVFDLREKVTRYTGTIPRVNPASVAELGLALKRIDRMARQVDPMAPWEARKAASWDATTVADWVRRSVFTRDAKDLIHLAVHAIWMAEPEEISLLHFLAYTSAAGSIDALLDTEGGAQDSRVSGGTQRISEAIAGKLGDRVMLGEPVVSIDHSEESVRVETRGSEVLARRVVVAIPPALAGHLAYRPEMPPLRRGLTDRMLPGSAIKGVVAYERPFWREQGLSGSAISVGSPLSMVFDGSTGEGGRGLLVCFFEAGAAVAAAGLSEDERREIVTSNLGRMFGPGASDPVEYRDCVWANEEFSRGCYGAFMPPGAWTGYGPALRDPVGPIHWAGAETATAWTGYMDGAISSGRRAASEVVEAL